MQAMRSRSVAANRPQASGAPSVLNRTRKTRPSSSPVSPKTSDGASTSSSVLTAFFYGRAFAQALNRRLGEFVVDVVAEVSKAAAERPQRIKEFQEEVQALARKELAAAGIASSSAGTGGGSATNAVQQEPKDVGAIVDELRAEVAYARAVLQQIRSSTASSSM